MFCSICILINISCHSKRNKLEQNEKSYYETKVVKSTNQIIQYINQNINRKILISKNNGEMTTYYNERISACLIDSLIQANSLLSTIIDNHYVIFVCQEVDLNSSNIYLKFDEKFKYYQFSFGTFKLGTRVQASNKNCNIIKIFSSFEYLILPLDCFRNSKEFELQYTVNDIHTESKIIYID